MKKIKGIKQLQQRHRKMNEKAAMLETLIIKDWQALKPQCSPAALLKSLFKK